MVILAILISTCGLAQFVTLSNDLHLLSYPSVTFIATFCVVQTSSRHDCVFCGRSHQPIVLISVNIDECLCELDSRYSRQTAQRRSLISAELKASLQMERYSQNQSNPRSRHADPSASGPRSLWQDLLHTHAFGPISGETVREEEALPR